MFINFFILIFLVSFVIDFGVWERHCFTIFLLFIDCVNTISFTRGRKNLIFFILCISIILISSANIRFNYYNCDDYKGVYNYIKEIILMKITYFQIQIIVYIILSKLSTITTILTLRNLQMKK